MEPKVKVGILGGGFGGLYAVFYQERHIKADVIFEYCHFLLKIRVSPY
jgi:thioredoxin reductase